MALWYDEMKRNLIRMERAKERSVWKDLGSWDSPIFFGGIPMSAAPGAGPPFDPDLQRDHHAEYFTTLAIVASSVEKFSVELRHLQRTEVLEAEEFFSMGQKGSSAMPHKRNPISAENLSGLARLVRSYGLAAWRISSVARAGYQPFLGGEGDRADARS
jgi:adenylosuccinate lyase